MALFSYVGIDYMANQAEEAKNPVKDIPKSILIVLGILVSLYFIMTLSKL